MHSVIDYLILLKYDRLPFSASLCKIFYFSYSMQERLPTFVRYWKKYTSCSSSFLRERDYMFQLYFNLSIRERLQTSNSYWKRETPRSISFFERDTTCSYSSRRECERLHGYAHLLQWLYDDRSSLVYAKMTPWFNAL